MARTTNVPEVADTMEPMLDALLGNPLPVRFEFWDDSALGPDHGPGTLRVKSPDALRRIL